MGIKALSIRQPWAWLIVNGWKDIENRIWSTSFRGRFLVHASKTMTREEYEDAKEFALDIKPSCPFPDFDKLERGGIVGDVELVGCVTASDSPWFVGEFGFQLQCARVARFRPMRGALGFFTPSFSPFPPVQKIPHPR